jgi:predicted RecB family nuclease
MTPTWSKGGHPSLSVTSPSTSGKQLPHLCGLTPIIKALKRSQYYTAFRHMVAKGGKSLAAFHRLVQNQSRAQVLDYTKRPKSKVPKLESIKSIQEFSWERQLAEWKNNIPIVLAACDGALGSSRSTDSR